MREAGRLNNEAEARTISDYLIAEGIENAVEREAGEWVLWIHDADEVEQAKAELAAFHADPHADKYTASGPKAAAIRKHQEREAEAARKRHVDFRKHWQQGVATRGKLTMVLVGLSIAVAVLTGLGQQPDPVGHWLSIAGYETVGNMIRWSGLSQVTSGQLWRLVTPIFIHYGPIHLIFNMMWLYSLGNLVEARRGSLFLLFLVLVTAIPSNLAQYYLAGPSFGGMSGVDYGLLGYVWIKGRYDPSAGMAIGQQTMVFMLGWLALGFFGVFSMANGAHVGGLVMGLVIGGARVLLRRAGR